MKKLYLTTTLSSLPILPILFFYSCSTSSLPSEISNFLDKITNANSKEMNADLESAKILVKKYINTISKIDDNDDFVKLSSNSDEALKFFDFPNGIEQIPPFSAEVQILSAKQNIEGENAKIILRIRIKYSKVFDSQKLYSNEKDVIVNFWGQ